MNKPTPQEIRSAREAAGLTQSAASEIIYKQLLAWQRYESGDRSMDPALFELFLLKTGQLKIEVLFYGNTTRT